MLPLQHIVHHGTEPWVPSPKITAHIAKVMKVPVQVEWIPRRAIRALWAQDFSGRPFPGDYAFRAYSRGSKTKILVDPTETADSALWLLLHELAHTQLAAAPMLEQAYRSVPRGMGYVTTDAGHEASPEEQLANLVADQWMRAMGKPAGLNRTWWRARAPR